MTTAAARLEAEFESLRDRLARLIRGLDVHRLGEGSGSVVLLVPDYWWDDPTPEQINEQIAIKRAYGQWIERLRQIFRGAPSEIVRQIDEADQDLCTWIELESNWSISPDRDENERNLFATCDKLVAVLRIAAAGPEEILVLPDTNVLLDDPSPENYRSILSADEFVMILVPMVISELDELKRSHNRSEVREGAKAMIRRIRGWSQQGSLIDGVTVDRSITVRAIDAEPDMASTLSWLDQDTPDDRFIASALEVQARHPACHVVVLSSDNNLLNKAEVAGLDGTRPRQRRGPRDAPDTA